MMFFLKDIKRFLFFSSNQPMQRYAGNGRNTHPKWPLKRPPENCGVRNFMTLISNE